MTWKSAVLMMVLVGGTVCDDTTLFGVDSAQPPMLRTLSAIQPTIVVGPPRLEHVRTRGVLITGCRPLPPGASEPG